MGFATQATYRVKPSVLITGSSLYWLRMSLPQSGVGAEARHPRVPKTLAIMQPYLFPYVGYFQLIRYSDVFVIYDDVLFSKGGWLNRNRIISAQGPQFFTLPLDQARISQTIREVRVQGGQAWKRNLLETIRHRYGRASEYERISPWLRDFFDFDSTFLVDWSRRSVVETSRLLNLPTRFVESSTGYGNTALRGTDRVLDICSQERATKYLNLPGGRSLYSDEDFAEIGTELLFLVPNLRRYRQVGSEASPFLPGLSILDLLMNVSVDKIVAGYLNAGLSSA